MKIFKKITLILMCVILATSMLTGCKKRQPETTGDKAKTESMKLFFPAKDNSKLGVENHDISFGAEGDRLKALISELVVGPKDQTTLSAAVSAGTKLNSATINGTQATLDFSKEFQVFGGVMDEGAKIAAVVDTALQVPGLIEVKITIDGKDLIAPSGMPYGFMKYREFNTTANVEKKEVVLYFANVDADGVVAEKRVLDVPKDSKKDEFYTMVVNALISGPTNTTLYKTIPPEAKILKLQVDGEIITIDFSKEMYTKHWKGAAGESMTLASIVNTLTEYPEIKRVMLLIEGQPMNIDVEVVNEPLTRRVDMIKQK